KRTTPTRITPTKQKPASSAQTAEEVSIVVEPTTNAIVIRSSRRKYETLLRLIRKLDIFPKQVLIEVMIAEVKLDDDWQLGVEWEYASGVSGSTRMEYSSTIPESLENTFSATGGLIYTITQADRLKATLHALAVDQKVNIISTPLLLSSEHEESRINVGEEVPIITDVTVSKDLTTDQGREISDRTIKYRDTGITLSVTPRINDSGLVKLKIAQEISEISTISFGNTDSPSFFKRSAETNVITTDSQSVVIAGLIRNKFTTVDSGIPLLKDIPLLGYLFKSEKKIKERQELIITITPYIIHDMADAKRLIQELKEESQRLKRLVGKSPGQKEQPAKTSPRQTQPEAPQDRQSIGVENRISPVSLKQPAP
ncbi:MAG: hypothetical protein PVG03_14810, partial [Desulfarculaceae bacterium]